MIGFVPGDLTLFIAAGGSGHAYKFLPVIGHLVADAIQGVLPGNLVKKFAIDRQPQQRGSPEPVLRIERRIDTTRKFDENSLSMEKDLLPPQI